VLRDFVYDKLGSASAGLNYPKYKQKNILSAIGEAMLRNRNIAPHYQLFELNLKKLKFQKVN